MLPTFISEQPGATPTSGAAGAFFKLKRRIPKEGYTRHLPAGDVLLDYREQQRAGRYAYALVIQGETYLYTKAHFWLGANARCYIARGPGGAKVAVKEMRRTRYLYEDSKRADKPRHLTDSTIMREYDTCMRLGMSLRPMAAACTPTKAYMVLPLAHDHALSLATALLPRRNAASPGGVTPGVCDVEGFLSAILRDCSAHLSKLHQVGVIHNDVKMNNIVFCLDAKSGQGHFELLDFGMSYDTSKGEYEGSNLFYGAPETRLHENDFDGSIPESSIAQDGKRDCFSLGLSCIWIALGGMEDFEKLLPANICGGSREETADAYRAFEQARRQVLGKEVSTENVYQRSWEAFNSRTPAIAAQYRAVWEKLQQCCSPELFSVISGLLAFDPEERWTAKQACSALSQVRLSPQETKARLACAQVEPNAIIQRHLDAAYAALSEEPTKI